MAARSDLGIDWQTLARKANYSLSTLASLRAVSIRQLERNFLSEFGQSPTHWLNGLRLRDARKLLQKGGSIKMVASAFGYRHYQSFSRAFKGFFGVPPSSISRNRRPGRRLTILIMS